MPLRKQFEQFLHLDEEEYAKEIAQLNEEELVALHKEMKQKWIGAKVGGGASVGTMVGSLALGPIGLATGALGVASVAVSGRRANVNRRRKEIIQARLEGMGWDGYHLRKRDYIIPTAAAGAGALVAPAANKVFSDLGSHAATRAGELVIHKGGRSAVKYAITKGTRESMAKVSALSDAKKAKRASAANGATAIAEAKDVTEVGVIEVLVDEWPTDDEADGSDVDEGNSAKPIVAPPAQQLLLAA